MPMRATASNAGWAKWALAAIVSVTTAMYAAVEIQWPRPERQRLPEKTPRLRAGRAARVGGKSRTEDDPTGATGATCGRKAWRIGCCSNARCMVPSVGNGELVVSMRRSLRPGGARARGRIRHWRGRIFCMRGQAGRPFRRSGRRLVYPPFVL